MLLYRATEILAYPVVRAYFHPEVTGLENVPRSGPAIIAANHLSACDEVFTPVSARRQVLYFAKAEYFTQPGIRGRFIARVFSEFGHIPVDRADTHAAATTIHTGVELLERGNALGIYPEGTRSPDGRLYEIPDRGCPARPAFGRSGDPGRADRHRGRPDRRRPEVASQRGGGAFRCGARFLGSGGGREVIADVARGDRDGASGGTATLRAGLRDSLCRDGETR